MRCLEEGNVVQEGGGAFSYQCLGATRLGYQQGKNGKKEGKTRVIECVGEDGGYEWVCLVLVLFNEAGYLVCCEGVGFGGIVEEHEAEFFL